MKKLSLLLTLLAPALVLPSLRGQTYIETDNPLVDDRVGGNVSPVTINLAINETIGGYRITDAELEKSQTKGIEYAPTITYNDFIGSPSSNILNPYGWNEPTVDNYVEQKTNRLVNGSRVITASGSNKIAQTRYTNATLLAEVAAAYPNQVANVRDYRIVAVRFDLPVPEVVYNNGTYATVVREGLYFFAENSKAPNTTPVFLGAETNVYAYPQLIDFASYETADEGKYVETFTDPTGGNAFTSYQLLSDSYKGLALAEFSIYRRANPAPTSNYYEMRVGGVFNWSETWDTKKIQSGTYNRGAISGKSLAGPGIAYVNGQPTEAHEAVVTGSITLPAATYRTKGTLRNYLNAIPPQAQATN